MKKLKLHFRDVAKYMNQRDKNIQQFLDSKGTVRQSFTHVCFGRTSNDERTDFVKQYNKDNRNNPVTHIRVVQANAVAQLANIDKSKEVLSIMSSWNLFRNCEIEVAEKDIYLKFPLDTIKAQEIWFVGWCVRHLACHPIQMLKFLQFCKKYPEYDTFKLFLVSLTVTSKANKYRIKEIQPYEDTSPYLHLREGHFGIYQNSALLVRNISVKEIQEQIDSDAYKLWTTSKGYNFNSGLMNMLYVLSEHLIGDALKKGYIWVPKEARIADGLTKDRDKIERLMRLSAPVKRNTSLPFTKETIESFFDFDKLDKYIFSTTPDKERVINAFNFTW
jgi:hypothetical protein